MAKIKIEDNEYSLVSGKTRYYIYCPACYEKYKQEYPNDKRYWINGCIHAIDDSWQFNQNFDKPTLSPSLLCRYGDYICHSFIKDGMIQYLSDCTHGMANRTVELLDVPLE